MTTTTKSKRPARPKKKPVVTATTTLVEVPRAALHEAAMMTWPDLLVFAEGAGWRVQLSNDWLWCAPDHALLRAGRDEMHGLPVLRYQNW